MPLMLLIATGLMVKSANHLWRIDPGFDPQRLLTMTIFASEQQVRMETQRRVFTTGDRCDSKRCRAYVAPRSSRACRCARGSFLSPPSASKDGRTRRWTGRQGRLRVVSPGYFGVMHIPILSGRDYDEHDEVGDVGSLPSVIVNRTLAERFWPGQDAVGKECGCSWNEQPVDDHRCRRRRPIHRTRLPMPATRSTTCPKGLYPQSAITLLVRSEIAIPCRSISRRAPKNRGHRQGRVRLRREADDTADG